MTAEQVKQCFCWLPPLLDKRKINLPRLSNRLSLQRAFNQSALIVAQSGGQFVPREPDGVLYFKRLRHGVAQHVTAKDDFYLLILFERANETARHTGNLRYVDFTEAPLRCRHGEKLELDALDAMREALAAIRWPTWQKAFCTCVLAEHYARCGHVERGLDLLGGLRREGAETCMEPELPRLQGELLLRREAPDQAAAERCMREAVALARQQEAKSWELRAATSLARLLLQGGRRDEARQALAAIYGEFTEGFNTADLRSARALLEEIA